MAVAPQAVTRTGGGGGGFGGGDGGGNGGGGEGLGGGGGGGGGGGDGSAAVAKDSATATAATAAVATEEAVGTAGECCSRNCIRDKLYHPIRPHAPVRQGVQLTISGVDAARIAISGEVVRGAWPMRLK